MILYNVTIKIDHTAHVDWMWWMKKVHIPEVMGTGCFVEYKFCRILGDDDEQGVTYAIQYFSPDMATFKSYQANHAPRLQRDLAERYPDKYVAFRTLMEVLN
ncbi:MAG TPA: DUF4286 family protein [Flavilitoribacter sp.]|nr:DUF4286 family protein [Flavilitoribacter sp.]